MTSDGKSTRDGIFNIVSTLFGLLIVFAAFAYRPLGGYLPSQFHAGLQDKSYFYWHHWINVSTHEAVALAGFTLIVFALLQTWNPVYRIYRRHALAMFLIFCGMVVAALAGRDLLAGYALYPDRILVRPAFSLSQPRSYSLDDIQRIEVGCHERLDIRKRYTWYVPSYKIVFRDGVDVSPFDLADNDFKDPRLMSAILRLDSDLRARGVEKVYRRNFVDIPMNGDRCFGKIEQAFDPDLHPAMRQAFHLP